MTIEEAIDNLEYLISEDCTESHFDYVSEIEMAIEALNKAAEYEDLEEQGLLLRLPCKVGDKVWSIRWGDKAEESVMVDGKRYFRNVYKHKVTKEKFSLYDYESIGKTVFLTREEAEAKLKEMGE